MKITIATGPIYPVPAVLGGSVQRLWHGLALEFARRGHEVTIFAKAHEGQPEEEVVDGIRFVRWGGYDLSTSIATDLVRCFIYALRAAPRVPAGDVVIANDFWTPAVLPFLNRTAGPVVACVQRFPKKQFALYGRCHAIVAVSEAVAEAIRQQTPRLLPKVHVIPNNVDPAFIEMPATKRTSGPRDPVRILFAGRIHPEKGLELLIGALRLLPCFTSSAWQCEIIGPDAEAEGGGGAEFAGRMRMMAEGLPVAFTPPVYDARELAAVYDRADVFVYPSLAEHGESFGLAPLEAMARGLIPVVSALSVFRDYLRDGENGMVFDHRNSSREENLARALAKAIDSSRLREEMSKQARATARGFSTPLVADKYLDLFQHLTR